MPKKMPAQPLQPRRRDRAFGGVTMRVKMGVRGPTEWHFWASQPDVPPSPNPVGFGEYLSATGSLRGPFLCAHRFVVISTDPARATFRRYPFPASLPWRRAGTYLSLVENLGSVANDAEPFFCPSGVPAMIRHVDSWWRF
jgi:hypothetical protein